VRVVFRCQRCVLQSRAAKAKRNRRCKDADFMFKIDGEVGGGLEMEIYAATKSSLGRRIKNKRACERKHVIPEDFDLQRASSNI
jgi:hypothetical protein